MFVFSLVKLKEKSYLVWFTQKNSFGATELYSLAEYKVRSTSPFERDYLLGKYGATPIIGDIEKIFNPSK
mgnify:CR=1 FL=1